MAYEALGDSQCARTAPSIDGTQMECIDANGNVLSSVPIGTATTNPPTPPGGSTFLGMSQETLLIVGIGAAALILFTGKKKGRR